MARLARVVAVGVPHHITQRGNDRQDVFRTDVDRVRYLELLAEHAGQWGVRLLGYCLMSNHVHLIAVPRSPESFARGIGRAHYRYTREYNLMNRRSGHLWQNRFYSCPLSDSHAATALRYVDLNPVRASIAERAEEYRWSSAAAHLGIVKQRGRSPNKSLKPEKLPACHFAPWALAPCSEGQRGDGAQTKVPIPELTLACTPPNKIATPCYPGTKTARPTERALVLSRWAVRANETGFPLEKPPDRERVKSINDLTLDRGGRTRKIAEI